MQSVDQSRSSLKQAPQLKLLARELLQELQVEPDGQRQPQFQGSIAVLGSNTWECVTRPMDCGLEGRMPLEYSSDVLAGLLACLNAIMEVMNAGSV